MPTDKIRRLCNYGSEGVRTYLKPRSRCTVSTPDGTQVVNTIIDLDARMDQVKRIEMMEEFLTDTVI